MRRVIRAALAALLAGLALLPASALAVSEADLLPVDEAYVLSATALDASRVQFTWRVAPGYYLYRHRFGAESVDPTVFTAGTLQLPAGKKHTDEFFGEVETYRQSVTATLPGTAAPGARSASFKVKYQGCADLGVCYPPQTRTLTVALPGGPGPAADGAVAGGLAGLTGRAPSVFGGGEALPEEQAFKVEAIANTPAELLVRLTPAPGYYLYRDKTAFRLADARGVRLATPRWPGAKPYRDEHFGDVQVYFDQAEVPVPVLRDDTAAQDLQLEVSFQGCLTDGICYPPMVRMLSVSLPAGAGAVVGGPLGPKASESIGAEAPPTLRIGAEVPPAGGAMGGFWVSVLLALLGGLILNLMPCVLPVLSFKALGLAEASRSRAHAQAHALWYTAGILVSFAVIGALVLGLRGAGQALGWGFQLQQPWVVGALALLMFAIGLNLSGLFQFGNSLAGVGQSLTEKSGAVGDFFTGVLAVVVASPCTAPFMAGALGYAFAAPVLPAMAVFLALGLGLALPFLLIGFVPALASRLPRPGLWMETLKHWLAFPMYFTAVWLVWVFGKQRGIDAVALLLIGMVLLALALWWYERQRLGDSGARKMLAYILLAVALGAMVFATRGPALPATAVAAEGTVPYSAAELGRLRAAGTPVFVDMTADWCITCKVNEKAVLHTETFRALLARTGTVYMVGDWTNQDAEISAFLDQYKSPGVPLYVVYPAGDGPGRRLPQLLSEAIMREALEGSAKP